MTASGLADQVKVGVSNTSMAPSGGVRSVTTPGTEVTTFRLTLVYLTSPLEGSSPWMSML